MLLLLLERIRWDSDEEYVVRRKAISLDTMNPANSMSMTEGFKPIPPHTWGHFPRGHDIVHLRRYTPTHVRHSCAETCVFLSNACQLLIYYTYSP